MMAGLRGWLLGIISVSLLCALADALMPPGAVKRVGQFICGLVMLAAVLSPLSGLDMEGGERWLDGWFSSLEDREAELREQTDQTMKGIIETECAAYIVDKAASFGIPCSARVECQAGEEGTFLPVRARVTGPLTQGQRDQLARILEEDLGIPKAGQRYDDSEEETP